MKRFLHLFLFLMGGTLAWSQPCGLEDTLRIFPNTQPTFNFEVYNIYNDDLSDPGQGVCGIELFFVHNYVEDLELTITSPGGQSVQLIGPNTDNPVAFTNFARWRLDFVPCAEPADPYPGTLPQWDNDGPNPWAVFGNYSGSYYPFIGCLEDFNTGPANGIWQIEVTNNPSAYPGAILGFRIIFCDERGLDCCFAASGDLDIYDDILACEGDSSLMLDIPPDYNGTPPDTNEYGYTYLIGADSILMEYDSTLDLTNFAPGRYQVCGLSYKRVDLDSFPLPDGLLSIDSLRRNLDGLEPVFCGEITNDCVWIQIVAPPDTTFLAGSICLGDSVVVGDSTLLASGSYDITLQSYAGCDSIVHFDLLAIPPAITGLDLTICQGDSVVVGSNIYTTTGTYIDTLISSSSCDSIVNLGLTVLAPVVLDTAVQLCAGGSFAVGDSLFTQAGNYEVTLPSSQGCDSIVRLALQVFSVDAVIADPDTLRCFNPFVTLDGGASTPLGNLAYSWQDLLGMELGTGPTLAVTSGGAYVLEVTRTIGTLQCSEADTVLVVADNMPPLADAGPTDTLTCDIGQLMVGGPNTSLGPDFSYLWSSSPNGNIVGAQNTPTAIVNEPGTYRLIVTDQQNGCRDTSTVLIRLDEAAPNAVAGPPGALSCIQNSVQLNGAGSSAGPAFEYNWVSTTGIIPIDPNTLSPTVTIGGTYQLFVTNTDNGCIDTAAVVVSYDTLAPQPSIQPPGVLNCAQLTVVLQGALSNGGSSPSYFWRVSGGGNIAAGANTLTPTVDAPGTYELVVENPLNGCRDSVQTGVLENVNVVLADAGPGGRLTCADPIVTLDAAASTTGPDIQYLWSTDTGHFTGGSLGQEVEVDAPGNYQLIVQDAVTFCADTASVFVTQDTIHPLADAGPARLLTCDSTTVTLDGMNSSTGPDYNYIWVALVGLDLIDDNTLTPTATQPGQYLLIVTDTTNGCIDTSLVAVDIDTISPIIAITPPGQLTCDSLEISLSGNGSSQGPAFSYQWAGPGLLTGADGLFPVVDEPGQYTFSIENTLNGCMVDSTVLVAQDTVGPVANAGIVGILTCDSLTVQLGGVETSMGPGFSYSWTTTAGHFVNSPDQPFVVVDSVGDYELVVTNIANGCQDTSATQVFEDNEPPFTEAGPGQELNCSTPTALLDGSASEASSVIQYLWTGPCLDSPADSNQVVVDCEGVYYLTSLNIASGCTGIDSVSITRDSLLPLALLPDSIYLSCENGTAALDASNSDGEYFEWYYNGQLINLGVAAIQVDTVGYYTLVALNTAGDCADSATTLVLLDCTLEAIIASPDTITCAITSVLLDATASSVPGSPSYQWIPPGPSCIAAGQGTPQLAVRCPGDYTLIITNEAIGLSDTTVATVFINDIPPIANAGIPDTLTCDEPTAILNASGSTTGSNIGYLWTNLEETFTSTEIMVEVNESGTYFLAVTDSLTGCIDEDIVVIQRSAELPSINYGAAVYPCFQDSFWLQAFVTPTGQPYSYNWQGDNILWQADTSAVVLDTSGIVTLTVTNTSNDCSATRSVMVGEQDCTPCVEVAPFDSLTCIVDTILLSASFCEPCIGCTVQWSSIGGAFLSPANALEVLVGAPGIYTITATDTLGFSEAFSVMVRENTASPQVDAGPGQQIDCDTPSALLGSNPADSLLTFQWTAASGAILAQDTLPTLEVDMPDTYTLLVTNRITGCTAVDEVIVTRDTVTPISDAGPSLGLTCTAPSGNLDGSGSTFGLDIVYQWSGPPGANIAGVNSFNPLVNSPGWYYLSVRDTMNGCIAIDSVLVSLQDSLPPVPNLNDTTLTCGTPTILLSGAVPPGPGYSFRWCRLGSNGQPDGPCSDALDIDISLPGIYRFQVTNETTGCFNFVDVEVSEDLEPPSVDAGADGTLLCTLDSLMLSGLAGPDTASLAYQWTAIGGSAINNPNSLMPTIFQPDTFQLEVTNLDNQCTAVDEVIVARDDSAPQASAGRDTSLTCLRTNLRLQGEFMTASGNPQFHWSSPNGHIVLDGQSPTPLIDEPGIYIFTLTDLQNGCTAVDTVLVVSEREPPTAVLEPGELLLNCAVDTLEVDGAGSFSATGGGLQFVWRRLPATTLGTGPTALLTETGNYRLIVTDSLNGCKDTLAFAVSGNFIQPQVQIAPPLSINCFRTAVGLNAEGSSAGIQYSNAWIGPAGDTLAETGLQATATTAGLYRLVITDENNGCQAFAQRLVAADTIPPLAVVRPPDPLDCMIRSALLDAAPSSIGDNITYLWSTLDGLLLGGQQSIQAEAGAPGWYVLAVTNTGNGCTARDSVEVIELATPIDGVLFDVEPPSCPGQMDGILAIDTVLGGTGPFLYALDGSGFSSLTNFENLPSGSYPLEVQDANGCEFATEGVVPESVGLSVELGPDIVIQLGHFDTLIAVIDPPGYDTLWWWPVEGLSDPGAPVQVVSPKLSTVYTVWVRNANGCIASAQATVKVQRGNRVYGPTVFSPNGDGQNDRYTLFAGPDVVSIQVFRIFDRWGNMVFEAGPIQPNDESLGWDGTLNGMEMDPAVFVFYAEVEFSDGIIEVVDGDLMLMR
ncbi:MAG: T9SS type B sorting domain-containing protein [Lewinellaceae bacterium]|nr:T9SS type B sorting domain-containing protein [Lewinellaceae bacterium]